MTEISSPIQTKHQEIHRNDPPFEILNTTRTHVDDDEGSMEEDEVVGQPLLSGSYGRRKAFEMEVRSRNQDETSTCFEETWKLVASAFLAVCLLGLFVHSYFQNHHGSIVTGFGLFSNTTTESCTQALEIDFSHLYQDMAANKTMFCDTALPVSNMTTILKVVKPVPNKQTHFVSFFYHFIGLYLQMYQSSIAKIEGARCSTVECRTTTEH